MRALAGVARGLRLGAYVRLGKGEEGTGGRDKSSILADTLEAVIGAVYLDRAWQAADALVHRLFDPVIARSARLGAGLDWKTSLQELTAAEILGVPEYHVEESGPDHQKSFRAFVRIGAPGPTARARAGPRRKPSSRPPRRPGLRSARGWPAGRDLRQRPDAAGRTTGSAAASPPASCRA